MKTISSTADFGVPLFRTPAAWEAFRRGQEVALAALRRFEAMASPGAEPEEVEVAVPVIVEVPAQPPPE